MVVFLHVIIALSSLGLITFSYAKPSKQSLLVGYVSVAATILSGVYLVWSEPARMLHTCVAGLAYLAVVSLAIVATHTRLVRLRGNKSIL